MHVLSGGIIQAVCAYFITNEHLKWFLRLLSQFSNYYLMFCIKLLKDGIEEPLILF